MLSYRHAFQAGNHANVLKHFVLVCLMRRRENIFDFIVLADDGSGSDDPLHFLVEIKGYRREDAKEKKSTMETYWVPRRNYLKTYGRWAFAEFTEVYRKTPTILPSSKSAEQTAPALRESNQPQTPRSQ